MNTIAKTLSPGKVSTYLWATAFVAGNVILPQICHAVNLGGKAFLPIMLFTVIGAARYGLTTGLLTAVLSPLVSTAITGMPSGAMLASVIVSSLLIVAVIGTWRELRGTFSILSVIALIAVCQGASFIINGAFIFGFAEAWGNLLMSWPGILIQAVALWAVTSK